MLRNRQQHYASMVLGSAILLGSAFPAMASLYHADGTAGATPDSGIPPNPLSYSLDLGVQAGGGVNFDYGPGVHAAADSEADGFGVHSHTYSQLILPSVSGSYSAGATATATAIFSDMNVKGPVGSMISTSLNMNLTGSLLYGSGVDAGSFNGDAETQAIISVYVNGTFVGAGGVYERFETLYGPYIHDTGMLSAWGTNNTGIVTPNFMVQSGVPFEVRLTLTTSAYTNLSSANGTGGTAEANTDFSHTFTFALDGPVFNLPVGYTADSLDAHILGNGYIELPGDANLDGLVNGQDIALVASNWLHTGVGGPGDANRDGIVNGQDIAMIATNWLQTAGGGAGAAAVPEPSSLILAALGGLALLAWRRRR